jgi:membrane associated rhomboid family serine protease
MTEQNHSDEDRIEPQAGGRIGQSQPVFNLPSLLVYILAAMVLIHLARAFVLSRPQDGWLIFTFSFIPARYVEPLSIQGYEFLWSPITYSLLHDSFNHLIFNGLSLMAFGAPVLRRIGSRKFIALFVISSAAAAFGYATVNDWQPTFLIGASGVVSALMGAACRFVFVGRGGGYNMALGHLNPRLTISQALSNRTVQIFAGLWFVSNLLIAFGIPIIGMDAGNIAWDAHIAGFLIGFLCFDLFDRDTR